MTPEQIRAALYDVSEKNDKFYSTIAPVLTGWDELTRAVSNALPAGTQKDLRAIGESLAAGNDGVHMLADASIHLGQALKALAAEY